ncbi:MAG: metallophosphoesterase [Bacteroidota bacterium]
MKIQYASDLHLEFPENEVLLWNNSLKPAGEILLLAGDVVPFSKVTQQDGFFDYISANFKTTYWVPGNHEYYHSDIAARRGSFCEAIRHNVFLVNDHAVTHENTRLIFSTLWTKVKRQHRLTIERRMNDFHLIRFNGNRLSCADLEIAHETSLTFIKRALQQATPEQKTIVVSHHVPTFDNYPPEYLGESLNEAFAVDLNKFIKENGPDIWIYGHHHKNIPGFAIGQTTLLTNQLGYVRNNENEDFDVSRIIDL